MGRSWLAVAAVLLAAATAYGNGRPPLTNSIHFRPGDPHSLYVGTTFGFLISHDDGCTFYWICEASVGYGGMYDPAYAVAADGTIYATTYTGLRMTHDDGCSWTTATDQLPMGDPGRLDSWIGAVEVGPTGDVWIGTADGMKANDLYRSTDGAATFSPLGQSGMVLWNSIQLAPSDAQHVYATSYTTGTGAVAKLVVSTNGGTSWTPSPLTNVAFATAPFVRVVAVDPQNADIVYLASEQGANPPNGDLLYRSSDGGMTFMQVLATTDPVRDVVIHDAQHVIVATQLGGSFESSDGGQTFGPLAGCPQLACLGQRGDGALIGCGTNWDPDFMAIATSGDTGASWQKVWRFVNIFGPMACPAGTAEHDTCEAMSWPILKQQFGATGPSCGANQWPVLSEAAPVHHGGCCDAADAASSSLVWASGLAWWLSRRRRPRK